MRESVRKQNQTQKGNSTNLTRSGNMTPKPSKVAHPILQLQRTVGNQAALRMLQSQEQVTLLAEPQLQRTCACGGASHSGGECMGCKEKKQKLQRKSVDSGVPQAVPQIVHDVLRSSGQPLSEVARTVMEPRFGHDFSRVRVHTDARAADSVQAVNAMAYTVGHHVVFGVGQYAPTTVAGKNLLAHELTHVVQQGDRGVPSQLVIGHPEDTHEREAEMATQSGLVTTSVHHDASGIKLQRQVAAAATAVPICTENPPPPTCTICLLPSGGVSWARGIAGPYIVIGGRAAQATGALTEDQANKDLRADPDCFPPTIGPTSAPPMPTTKKWWQFWK
jgi:uncharacterized protein DUF4157